MKEIRLLELASSSIINEFGEMCHYLAGLSKYESALSRVFFDSLKDEVRSVENFIKCEYIEIDGGLIHKDDYEEEPEKPSGKGEFRQDSDSHWYVIPDELLDKFDELEEKMNCLEYMDNPELFDKFEILFGKYRTGGGYTGYKVLLNEEEK